MWTLRRERSSVLPGDRFLAEPASSRTHAITIRRTRSAVWPWLAQMGAGRAGWYSYDFMDNGGRPSATTIDPELQRIRVGDLLPARPGETDGFRVLRVEPRRLLVLGWTLPDQTQPLLTWAYILGERAPDVTRLIVRARARHWSHDGLGYPDWTIRVYTAWGHPLMQQKQLLGIASRAEGEPRRGCSPSAG